MAGKKKRVSASAAEVLGATTATVGNSTERMRSLSLTRSPTLKSRSQLVTNSRPFKSLGKNSRIPDDTRKSLQLLTKNRSTSTDVAKVHVLPVIKNCNREKFPTSTIADDALESPPLVKLLQPGVKFGRFTVKRVSRKITPILNPTATTATGGQVIASSSTKRAWVPSQRFGTIDDSIAVLKCRVMEPITTSRTRSSCSSAVTTNSDVVEMKHEDAFGEVTLPYSVAKVAVATETDFLGVNYYSRGVIRSNEVDEDVNDKPNVDLGPKTDFGWEVYPQGLYDLLKRLHVEYSVQDIIITENGCSYSDGPDENKTVNDTKRIEYHKSHVEQIQIAVNDGIPCTGYFAWSFMDNFEWAEGYSQRFGLIWVDFETLERIPKESYYWYQNFIKSQK